MDTDIILKAHVSGWEFIPSSAKVYMRRGGVSDEHFFSALKEFFKSARELRLVGPLYAQFAPIFFAVARVLIKRLALKFVARNLKHLMIRLVNAAQGISLFFGCSKLVYRVRRMNIAPSASIAIGVTTTTLRGGLSVGSDAVVNTSVHLDTRGGIVIGSSVSVARGVQIYTAGHDVKSKYFEYEESPVRIGDRCAIFTGAMVMPGVRVGANSVVLPGAVVVKDVPDGKIVGGVPAQVIGSRDVELSYKLEYRCPFAS